MHELCQNVAKRLSNRTGFFVCLFVLNGRFWAKYKYEAHKDHMCNIGYVWCSGS